ncbi:non-ribosomal peptide synthetase/type I polyketide synthase [Streptacidiphilus sp. P02-A3a]|uniref:non-ribosomal peptide synthetase/type I polyketide synthase n=1 Tax=Streptacidiphilus sp. P02-A3a TaxID=2704468 RepID=UPI0015F7A7E9|nr:non-ribosomal peptide synthetase/type I polyketide synthase [Streptacidiphilus sp. P02-A3a]QMU70039.1 amino acid adenylation domain-containing protein [Streptacidiphilus sp. P02-A3a]
MDNAIAIVGMSGRFPGAPDVRTFWTNLLAGVSGIVAPTDQDLDAAGVPPHVRDDPAYVRATGALDGIEQFDAEFFGLTPREAQLMDPQQRIFLECAWHALEDCGHRAGEQLPAAVFGGTGANGYLLYNLAPHAWLRDPAHEYSVILGNDKDYLASRASYKLGLAGPSATVQTACSTSLVAVAMACQSLLDYQCDLALAGGSAVVVPHRAGYLYQESGIASPDGTCRPFDADANGTVRGSGAAVVALKRLDDALAAGDTVYAVIRGWAVNNDGSAKAGYTAPSVGAQAEVIALAHQLADVEPATIGFVEAHGTGTTLGDLVEVEALRQAFAGADGRCALGSVKASIGHLDAASGVTGLIKAALAVRHGQVPPTLNFHRPSPAAGLASSRFFVNAEPVDWPVPTGPRRAGVSSLGIGGTNAHVVLEQAPDRPSDAGADAPPLLLPLSARTDTAVRQAAERLADDLERTPADLPMADVAHTLVTGRAVFGSRIHVVAATAGEAAAALRTAAAPPVGGATTRPLAMMFPGQGAQHPGMTESLYRSQPVLRDAVDECAALLRADLGADLRDLLFPGTDPARTAAAAARLERTEYTQPALFTVEYALARLWHSWGVRPDVMVGHSIGEYACACLAGVLSLPDAAHLVALRGRLLAAQPPGGMLSVALAEGELRRRLPPGAAIAAVNAPRQCTVAGPRPELDALAAALTADGVRVTALRTSHAFHSPLVAGAVEPFRRAVGQLTLNPPRQAYVSSVTGAPITAEQATDPGYWADQLVQPVRWQQALRTAAGPRAVLLEVGPGQSLGALARLGLDVDAGHVVAATLPRPGGDERRAVLEAAGLLWEAGVAVDLTAVNGAPGHRVPLPGYPFQRRRHWIDAPQRPTDDGAPAADPRPRPVTAPDGPGAADTEAVRAAVDQAWAEVLLGAPPAPEDDFFQQGGQSLIGVQLLSRISQLVKVRLPLQLIFDHPTPHRLALAVVAEALRGAARPDLPITPADRGGALALSPAQERLWVIEQLEPGGSAYNVPQTLMLDGELDRAALERTFTALVARHEALRTRIGTHGDAPVQVVGEPYRVTVPLLLPGGGTGDTEAEAGRMALAELQRPFDLVHGPLLRAALIRISARRHLLVVTVHHLVTDGWSYLVLTRELVELYDAFTTGREPQLPPAPLQAADHAAWQRALVSGGHLAEQTAFWTEYLDGAPTALQLPTDRPRPAVQRHVGRRHRIQVPAALTRQLAALSAARGATPFATLLALFAAVLHAHADTRDLLVATPVAGRDRAELEGIVGYLVNTVVVRARLDGVGTAAELVDRVRESALKALSNPDVPFDQVVHLAGAGRQLDRNPLAQVLFTLENRINGDVRLAGLELSPVDLDPGIAQFDLALHLQERPDDGLDGWFEYDQELFQPDTVARLAEHFLEVLRRAVADPEQSLAALVRVPDQVRRLLTEVWNTGAERLPETDSLVDLFAAAVAAGPDRPAVVDGGRTCRYRELDQASDRIAALLTGHGTVPGDRVGVLLERGTDLIASVLGVLKTGAAYVPLDPTHPAERLGLAVADSGVRLVLTQRSLADRQPPGEVVPLFVDRPGADAPAVGFRPRPVDPLSPAYVIYTSGSTGRPKGVEVSHHNVVRLLRSSQRHFGFGPDDVFAQFFSHAFDVSVWEVFGALCHGAALVVVPYWTSRDPDAVVRLLAERRVTVLNQTPSSFQSLIEADGRSTAGPSALRAVVLCGENLDVGILGPWFDRHGDQRPEIVNMYGITETTVHTTYRRMTAADVRREVGTPIGTALPDLVIRLLDQDGELVPVGRAAEICVGGPGVALGYLNRPELTAGRFVADPFDPRPGARLYRSGDLARYGGDGELYYLGRADHQVQIRGYRVEPGEVQTVLAGHPGLAGAVVVSTTAPDGGTELVGYPVPQPGAEPPSTAELRDFLGGRVPEYMVPTHLVPIAEIPLTVNGKVDRDALPAPVRRTPTSRVAGTPVEKEVCQIWCELLGASSVGVDDVFFEIGGNSLSVVRARNRLTQRFGVELPLRALFEEPTAAAAARMVTAALSAAGGPRAATGEPLTDPAAPSPLSPEQEGIYLAEQVTPGTSAFHIGTVVRLRGALDPDRLADALTQVVARQEALRVGFVDTPDGVRMRLAEPGPGPLTVRQPPAGGDPEAFAAELYQRELARPFDLEQPPLARAALVPAGEREQLLVLVVHHLVCDGWSLGVLLDELAAAYADGPRPLPATGYREAAARARARTESGETAADLEWWRRHLDRHPVGAPLPELPGAPASGPFRATRRTMTLPAELRGQVMAACRVLGATPFALLATAFQLALTSVGVAAPVLGFPTAGRTPADEGLVGCFIRTAVLPSAERAPTFADAVGGTRDHLVAALEHGSVPADAARPRQDLYHAWFVLQNTPPTGPGPGGTVVQPVPQRTGTTKFRLALDITDTGDELVCWWDYAADVLGEELPQRVADGFLTVLTAAVAEPATALDELLAAARTAPATRRPRAGLRSVSRRAPSHPAAPHPAPQPDQHRRHGDTKQGDECS